MIAPLTEVEKQELLLGVEAEKQTYIWGGQCEGIPQELTLEVLERIIGTECGGIVFKRNGCEAEALEAARNWQLLCGIELPAIEKIEIGV